MSNSKRYFQLTPAILLEYNYAGLDELTNQSGESNYMVDLCEEHCLASVVNSAYNSSKNFVIDSNLKLWSGVDYLSRFVLPTNTSESKFLKCVGDDGKKIWDESVAKITSAVISGCETENTSDILFDKFRLHFTSRNYLGDYDGLIIRVEAYDKVKNKICLFSYHLKKTDNFILNDNPILVNQKLYTTYLDFEIPSINAIINCPRVGKILVAPGEDVVNSALSSYGLMDNSPMIFNIYGIKATTPYNQYEYYTTEQLASVYVPIVDKFDKVEIVIKEASDGDYFEIYPKVSSHSSFSDYIYNISDGRPDTYIIFHDLTLIEHLVDSTNKKWDVITHREQCIINAADAEDGVIEINETQLDEHMIYRPVIKNGSLVVSFTINDQMKILNTLDNTTIIKEGAYRYCANPKKYGKKMGKIYLGEIPAQVKVYNKRNDDETDNVKITNASSNATIENHQHQIIGFIECANIGVSIEQIPIESLEQ